MAVGSGAGAAAAGLDVEEVVEQGDDVVVVQVADAEGDDRQPAGFVVAEDLDGGVAVPAAQGVAPVAFLRGLDGLGPDGLFEGDDQPGADGLTMAGVAPSSRATGSSR